MSFSFVFEYQLGILKAA